MSYRPSPHKRAAVDLAIREGNARVAEAYRQGYRLGYQATVWPSEDRALAWAYRSAWVALQSETACLCPTLPHRAP